MVQAQSPLQTITPTARYMPQNWPLPEQPLVSDVGYLGQLIAHILGGPVCQPGIQCGVIFPVAGGAGAAAEGAAATEAAAQSEYTLTQTAENNLASRPYLNSPLTIQEIQSTDLGMPDPGGLPGALRYDVPGSFNGSNGTWQLGMLGVQNLF